LLPLALGVPAGFFAADILSGLVHWFCDTYFQPETRLIGPLLIAPFREHHLDPTALGRHGALERNGNNCFAALPLLAFGALGPWDLARSGDALGIGFLAAAATTLCVTNQIHAWAHTSSAPRVVRWFQRCGILLGPERHARHHNGSHKHAYAVVSGWSNRGLDWILARTEATLAMSRYGRVNSG
jgi:plasmanylethanolamine desaturase